MLTRRNMCIRAIAGACLSLVVTAAASGASGQPTPRSRFDLAPYLHGQAENTHLAFVQRDRILVTTGETQSNALILDLNHNQMVARLPFGECYVVRVWSTASGSLVVYCRDHFMTFDGDLKERAELPVDNWGAPIQISPSGNLFVLDKTRVRRNERGEWVTQFSKSLIDAGTLRDLPVRLPQEYDAVTDEGYISLQKDGVYFQAFGQQQPRLLFGTEPKCDVRTRVISRDKVLLLTCHSNTSFAVNDTGKRLYRLRDVDDLDAAQPSLSGDRFLLGFHRETRSYAFRHGINLLADLAGADVPPNLGLVRVYDVDSGRALLELKWKFQPGDPASSGTDEMIAALSGDGSMIAVVQGHFLCVYEVPRK